MQKPYFCKTGRDRYLPFFPERAGHPMAGLGHEEIGPHASLDERRGLGSRMKSRRIARCLVLMIVAGWIGTATASAGGCPLGMVPIEGFCIDLREAPNRDAALPLVMYTFIEAFTWCEAHDRRLCFDDEWTRACAGVSNFAYPYGNTHVPGMCNDEETWRVYNSTLLSQWPTEVSAPDVESLQDLLNAARAVSASGAASADHVESIYQGEPSASNSGCVSADGVFDLCGNIEEWTQRRDGGLPGFHGSLKGRYWAESRTCQQAVTSHGDVFRFYQLAFRCCRDPDPNLIFADGFETGDHSRWTEIGI